MPFQKITQKTNNINQITIRSKDVFYGTQKVFYFPSLNSFITYYFSNNTIIIATPSIVVIDKNKKIFGFYPFIEKALYKMK